MTHIKNTVLLFLVIATAPSLLAADTVDQLQSLFSEMSRVKIVKVGPLIVIDGQADKFEEMARITEIVTALNEQSIAVKSLVRLSPETLAAMAMRIEKGINSPEIGVRWINHDLVMEGIAESDFEADRALAIAKAELHHPGFDRSPTTVTPLANLKGPGGNGFLIVDMMRVKPRPEKTNFKKGKLVSGTTG